MAQDDDAGGTFHPFSAHSDTGTLFGQTMRLVALTIGLFTLGAYLARQLTLGGYPASAPPAMRLPAAARHKRDRRRAVVGGIDLPRYLPALPGFGRMRR